MDLLAQGLTGEQVAERLVLSAETVKTHIRNAMNKLEASTRVHAVAIALREGYISPPGERAVSCRQRHRPPAPRPAHAADDRGRLRRAAGGRAAGARRAAARVRAPDRQRGRGHAPDCWRRPEERCRSRGMASAIPTEGLTKRYGETLALDALDLDVEPGEVYGYLGPNGAGKTTTIRLLLGLHRPTAGRAELFGIDAWGDPVTRPSPRRLRRRRAVPVAGAHRRRDARLPGDAARRHRRRLPRRADRALPARHRQEGPRALEGQPPEGAADRRVRQPRRPADPRRADQRPGPADGGRVPRDRARGQGARARRSSSPRTSSARSRRCATASASCARGAWSSRARSRSCATSAPRPSRSRSTGRRRSCPSCRACTSRAPAAAACAPR